MISLVLNGIQTVFVWLQVGVNASSRLILERLVRSDTATAFNITSRDVNVTGITQVGRRVLLVNVSATLGVDLPTNSSDNDVEAELAVKNLSADEAIDLMAFHPRDFWIRTTKVSPFSPICSAPYSGKHCDCLQPGPA